MIAGLVVESGVSHRQVRTDTETAECVHATLLLESSQRAGSKGREGVSTGTLGGGGGGGGV